MGYGRSNIKPKQGQNKGAAGGSIEVSPPSLVGDNSLTIPMPVGKAARDDLWRRVRRVYATGRHDDAALAAMFAHEGLTLQRLRTRRYHDRKLDPASWPEHLDGDVRVATKAILAQQAVVAEGGKADAVMAAARQVAGVLTRHRADALEARGAVMGTLGELSRTAVRAEDWEKLLKACEADLDTQARAALRQQFRHALSVHSRAGSLHKVADALLKMQAAERKAWGVPDDPKDASPLDSLSDDQLLAEIASLRQEIDGITAATGGNVVPLHGPRAA